MSKLNSPALKAKSFKRTIIETNFQANAIRLINNN